MASADTSALLVLGRADLLTGGPELRDADILTLAKIQASPAGTPNTVILTWSDLGRITLTARTVDGHRSIQAPLESDPLFDALRPAPALRQLLDTLTPSGAACPPRPLLYALATPTAHGIDIHHYSPVEQGSQDICLQRITPQPIPVHNLDDLTWVATALRLHAEQSPSLNSYQCAWRKAFPGQELEHKYTLPPDTAIWNLAVDTLHQIDHSALPGFTLKYHDEFQTWDYLNHLYDVHEPATERGYVSFIPTITGEGWRMKRKWFTTDAFARREQLSDLAGVTDLDTYVSDILHLQARRMPTFRRIRYDVNVESLATGHYYGIFFDRCHLTEQPTLVMCQCEIEYCRTRATQPPSETSVLQEIDVVADWIETLLARHKITNERSHYSKLSFLRRAVQDHPEPGIAPAQPGHDASTGRPS